MRVLENCINGRRTVWEDPFKAGRNGVAGLVQAMEMHSPLSLVVLMLGVNDFQSVHSNTALMSALGSERLIGLIRSAPIEPGMPVPEILLIAPPEMSEPKGDIAAKFEGAFLRSVGLSDALRNLAVRQAVQFLDAGASIHCSEIDGVHLDRDQHQVLGLAVAKYVLDKNLLEYKN